jgi:hypothetical protein
MLCEFAEPAVREPLSGEAGSIRRQVALSFKPHQHRSQKCVPFTSILLAYALVNLKFTAFQEPWPPLRYMPIRIHHL